jgi:hypothetical protein
MSQPPSLPTQNKVHKVHCIMDKLAECYGAQVDVLATVTTHHEANGSSSNGGRAVEGGGAPWIPVTLFRWVGVLANA